VRQQTKAGRIHKGDDIKLTEETRPDLVHHLSNRLEYASGVVNELVNVYIENVSKKNKAYNIDKAYQLEIEIENKKQDEVGAPGTASNARTNAASRGKVGAFDP